MPVLYAIPAAQRVAARGSRRRPVAEVAGRSILAFDTYMGVPRLSLHSAPSVLSKYLACRLIQVYMLCTIQPQAQPPRQPQFETPRVLLVSCAILQTCRLFVVKLCAASIMLATSLIAHPSVCLPCCIPMSHESSNARQEAQPFERHTPQTRYTQ